MPPAPISSSVNGHNFVLRHMLLVSPTCRGGKNKKTKRLFLSPIISISSFSSKKTKPGKSLTEKQGKELREMKGGINILDNLNNRCLVSQICVFLNKVKKEGLMVYFYLVSRERQIMDIEASFEACKSQPIHSTNKNVQPVEVLPLLAYFDRLVAPYFPFETILNLNFRIGQFFLIIALHVDTTMKPLKPDTLRYYMYVGIL
ncbi:unnamed protein product [Arabidopsis lyrata]|uniref:Uncharacterized protein n=1 Tax=Arabidopsis lyrata subsp. lyrata TaxID=81972 RepID=D7KUX8_ARALL|nr:hypothetical protein ARALYDRAFT_894419 [Arabidopsis lyrata subsp. lyrata]CAH8257297.1 unnamed protein product [Arabidopsis lyrata]